jgi:hypothetical protein
MIGPATAAKNPGRAVAHYLAGTLQLAANRPRDAIQEFEKAESLGNRGDRRDYAEAFAALRDYPAARRIAQLSTRTGAAAVDLEMRQIEVSLPLDQGQWAEALEAARRLEANAESAGAPDLNRWLTAAQTLLLRSYAPDAAFDADLAAFAGQQAGRMAGADSIKRRHVIFNALAAGWMAAHNGDRDLAREMLALVRDDPLLESYPANAAMARVVEAEIAIGAGKPGEAIALLAPVADTDGGLYFERAVLMRAHAANGDLEQAAKLADWLAGQRGRAFAEASSIHLWQSANLIENNLALDAAARYAEQLGNAELADAHRKAFEQAWPGAGGLALVRRRSAED